MAPVAMLVGRIVLSGVVGYLVARTMLLAEDAARAAIARKKAERLQEELNQIQEDYNAPPY